MRFKCNRESANGSLHSPNLNPPGPLKKDGREHLNQQIAIFYPFFENCELVDDYGAYFE